MKEPRTKVLERWINSASSQAFTIEEEESVKADLLALMVECGAILEPARAEKETPAGESVDAVLRTLNVGLSSMRRAIDGSVYCTPEVQKQFEKDIPEYENALRILSKTTPAEAPNLQTRILAKVIEERRAQDAKWGVQNHGPMTWLAILAEEFGETAKAILEGDGSKYLAELVQVAAVAVASVETYYRGETALISVTGLQLEVKKLRALLTELDKREGK